MKILIKFCLLLLIATSIDAQLSEEEGTRRLQKIHSKLSLIYGSFQEEYPEQLLSAMFIAGNDKVLELGGNVGRNSCVIASLLNNSRNLVVTESDPVVIPALMANRDHNSLLFQIEDSAISQVPLIQTGWLTIPGEVAPPGYVQVKTITYNQLKEKYGIPFTTLVADCEGALYYILQDDESILDDVSLIIAENDYTDRNHFDTVCAKFVAHGFQLVHNRIGGWGPCYNEFYQVWRKK